MLNRERGTLGEKVEENQLALGIYWKSTVSVFVWKSTVAILWESTLKHLLETLYIEKKI